MTDDVIKEVFEATAVEYERCAKKVPITLGEALLHGMNICKVQPSSFIEGGISYELGVVIEKLRHRTAHNYDVWAHGRKVAEVCAALRSY